MKEREFMGLKQGNMSVMEYASKFNELSRFAPHQVSTEERRMDHFEQGLKGNIKSMIAKLSRTFRLCIKKPLKSLESWKNLRVRTKP